MKLHYKKFNLIKDLLISKLGERVKFSEEYDDETLEIRFRVLADSKQNGTDCWLWNKS